MPASRLPLTGVRVLELASIGPVPFAGRALRLLGAKVTLVSSPQPRGLGIPMPEDPLDRDKSRITVDLKDAAGREALLSLARSYDALIEGFRPGTIERLGLTPASLLAANPALVVGRCGGWGSGSPRSTCAGHDINFLAVAGVLGAIGPGDKPCPPLNLIGDFGGAAMHLALGVVAALLDARATGVGGVVTTSIFEATAGLTAHLHGLRDAGMWNDERESNLLDGGAPFYRCYQTSDARWIAVGAIEPKFFVEFMRHLDVAFDADRQYDRTHWAEMVRKIEARFATRTRDEWTEHFGRSDACVSPVLEWSELRAHPDSKFAFDAHGPKSPINFKREST